METEFIAIAPVGEIPPGERIFIELDGKPIVILNVGGKYYAIGDVCSHDDGPLGDGEVDGKQIICPRHGARFDLESGKALTLPAVKAIPWYAVRIREGMIELEYPGKS